MFAVTLDRCVGSCNTLSDFSNKVCVSNKTENLNLHVFNIITGKNLSKMNVSCECKNIFDGRKCKPNQKWNNDKCQCEYKTHNICEKDYIWNPATCSCKNGKYLASITDDSVIMCDKIVEETKTVPTMFNEKW